jgi:hypothetical protein
MKLWATAVLGVLCLVGVTVAEIPLGIGYQGRVTDNLGDPVADGTYTMRFRIYDQFIGGTELWDSGNRTVTLDGGVFSVILGGSGQPSLDLAFDDDYWLQVTFDGESQTPRRPLVSVGYAYTASGLVAGTEVTGAVTDIPYAAIKGTNTGTTNDVVGLYGESACPGGGGVYGYGTATTDDTYGVLGISLSTAGMGVYGLATATTGATHGVHGESVTTSGTGVYGHASASHGVTSGVYGCVSSTDGSGVYGEGSATTGFANGVYGRTRGTWASAVYGFASADSGTTYGVYGYAASPEGCGVYGTSSYTAETGICYGGKFQTGSTEGMGVHAKAYATSGVTYGVYGQSDSPSGYGVYYSGGWGGSGKMASVVLTSKGPTALGVHTTAGDWVEDFGEGQLVNGRCHVELDPFFLETVTIDKANPMKVFVEPGGTCEGVYVEKGSTGFSVVELHDGRSSVAFDYRIVAKRKGFESHRLDYCEAAERDPNLYPELRDEQHDRIERERARLERETRETEAREHRERSMLPRR